MTCILPSGCMIGCLPQSTGYGEMCIRIHLDMPLRIEQITEGE